MQVPSKSDEDPTVREQTQPPGQPPQRSIIKTIIVRLYVNGRLSSGLAARLLRLSRREFLDLLGLWGISYFDPNTVSPTDQVRALE